ncbi:hypothetical protein BH11PSE3_BH11PSE3_32710 [soil metagenome]
MTSSIFSRYFRLLLITLGLALLINAWPTNTPSSVIYFKPPVPGATAVGGGPLTAPHHEYDGRGQAPVAGSSR